MINYIIASTPYHYKMAHKLITDEGVEDAPLNFPTILSVQDTELTGVLGTDTSQSMIIAGPLVVKSNKRRPFTVLGLIEYYEHVMTECGISSFIFSVEEKNTIWLDKIYAVTGLEPYAHKDGRAFFIRNL